MNKMLNELTKAEVEMGEFQVLTYNTLIKRLQELSDDSKDACDLIMKVENLRAKRQEMTGMFKMMEKITGDI